MRIVILPDLIYHAISHSVFNMLGLPILSNVQEHPFTLGVKAPPGTYIIIITYYWLVRCTNCMKHEQILRV